MINRIPREMLWKDRETLLQSPLFNALHEVFFCFEKEPMLFPMDELAILNEVGYQVTWLCYESRFGLNPDMEQFTREVFAHTGLKDHAMTVISLVYATVELVNFPPLEISKEAKRELKKLHRESWCRRYIDTFIKRVAKEGLVFNERFLPNQELLDAFLNAIHIEEEQKMQICAKPLDEEDRIVNNERVFTLDAIVEYAKENLSLDASIPIQNMLYSLLGNDGTAEEREKVNSIPQYIRNRDRVTHTVGQMIGRQNNFGDVNGLEALLKNEEIKKLLGSL